MLRNFKHEICHRGALFRVLGLENHLLNDKGINLVMYMNVVSKTSTHLLESSMGH